MHSRHQRKVKVKNKQGCQYTFGLVTLVTELVWREKYAYSSKLPVDLIRPLKKRKIFKISENVGTVQENSASCIGQKQLLFPLPLCNIL
jgi:hypothetical protein